MYRKFFGLKKLPFKVTLDSEFFFEYAERNQIIDALIYSISRGDPIIKVIGDVGCGKSTILRQLLNHISNTKYRLIHISSPNLTSKDILLLICGELDIPVKGDEEKYVVMKLIQQKLFSLHNEGYRAVTLVDEAQTMPIDTLEELRLLSNLETDTDKLLQVVLFGQPELDKTLQIPQLRQLQSRIAYEIYLEPLNPKEVWRYLNYRMQRAGYSGEPVFSKKIACKVHKFSHGLPREINFLADKLLMSAFSHGDEQVKSKHFKEIGYKGEGVKFFFAGLMVISVISVIFYLYFDKSFIQEMVEDKVAIVDSKVEVSTHSESLDKLEKLERVEPIAHQHSKDTQVHHGDAPNVMPVNSQKFAVQKENIKLQRLARALNSSLPKVKPIFELYEKANSQIARMLQYTYTIQLMVGSIEALPVTYYEVKRDLPQKLKGELIPLIDLKSNRFILVVSYSNDVLELRSTIKQLPSKLKRYAPYVMMMSKYQRIFERTEDYLQNGPF